MDDRAPDGADPMIWNKDILFLHVPKTGGISVTTFLLTNLSGAPHYTAEQPMKGVDRATFHEGTRHETLVAAEAFHSGRGHSVTDFDAVFAVMRNPYDLEVSRYHYLRKGHKVDRGPAQDLAKAGDFDAYLESAPFFGAFPPRLDRYFRIGDCVPANLRVLRFESLERGLREKVGPYLEPGDHSLGHLNRSKHDEYWSYYNERSEDLCYRRHRWFFDMAFYDRRFDFVDLGGVPPSVEHGPTNRHRA